MVYSILNNNANYHKERRIPCRNLITKLITLARKLLSTICAELIVFLRKIINSDDFIAKHRQSPTNFTRQRKLSFSVLLYFLMNLVKGSYQDELDHFFKTIFGFDVAKRFVTKAALTKARMKLKYEAFIELNEKLTDHFYKKFKSKTWNGFTLLAIDGTTVQLPRIETITDHFGAWNTQGGECPKARASQMFDPINQITVDAIIKPKDIGERELAAYHFLKLMPNDLILLDRGYPAYWLFNLVLSRGADFCGRIKRNQWKIVRQFYTSGKKEKIISLPVSRTSVENCKELNLDLKPLKLRLIKVELETGEAEILITSLTDSQQHPYEEFADLYHLRWPVEEDYKTMKKWIEIENFSGKSVLSVYQDFHAKIFTKNLVSALTFPTQVIIDKRTEHRRYRYKMNFAQSLSKIKDVIPLLFIKPSKVVFKLVSEFQSIVIETIEPIRPRRRYPRNHNKRRGQYYYAYRPIR